VAASSIGVITRKVEASIPHERLLACYSALSREGPIPPEARPVLQVVLHSEREGKRQRARERERAREKESEGAIAREREKE